jgi:hypothetical protein
MFISVAPKDENVHIGCTQSHNVHIGCTTVRLGKKKFKWGQMGQRACHFLNVLALRAQ